MNLSIVILLASTVWFALAAILFFNPLIGKIYESQEAHVAVKQLTKNAKTMGAIFLAVLINSMCLMGECIFVDKKWFT